MKQNDTTNWICELCGEIASSGHQCSKHIPQKKIDKEDAYNRGFDCGKFGPTEHNCHFSIFSSAENVKEWERGKSDGEKQKKK